MMSPSKQTVIVTGSSGLIGSAVVNRLARTFTVVGFDRAGPPHPPPTAESIAVDLASDESVREGLARVRHAYGQQIASVVHLAAYYDFSGDDSPLYEQITVRGTERLLRGLSSFDVGQFVFSSTMLVHAPTEPGRPIDENWPLEPKWAYPQSKVETETLLREQHGLLPLVLLRIAGVYDQHCHSIPIANQIQRIYERRMTAGVFPGDVSRGQSFVHLDDLVDAIEKTVHKRAELPAELALLIGESETLSYDELQKMISRQIHGEAWETRQIPKVLAKAGAWFQDLLPGEEPFIKPWMIDLADDHYELDIRRARSLLGWEPRHSLRHTVPRMIEALLADPAGWYRENKLELPANLEEPSAASRA